MTRTPLLIASLASVAACEPALAATFQCELQRYVTSAYEKDGRWTNRVRENDRGNQQLRVTVKEDGSSQASIEDLQHRFTIPAHWLPTGPHIAISAPLPEGGGFVVLSIFKEVEGKRAANYSMHTGFGYGAVAGFSGFCAEK